MDIFKLKANQTTVGREIVAGMVTFMAMAYIIFVNPKILAAAMGDELLPALAVATCLGAGILSILMGLVSNYPLAMASGMGLNAFLAYSVIIGMKVPWQTAMGIVFLEGAIISILVLTRIREKIMDAIPLDLKRGIGVGIGLLIALIGLQNARLVVADPATLIAFGKLGPESLIAIFGLVLTAILMVKKVRGSFLIGIFACTAAAAAAGLIRMPASLLAGIKPEYFKTFFALDIFGAIRLGLLGTLFAFLITDFFDTMGTVVAVGEQAGFMDRAGRMPRLKNVLFVDSLGALCGGLFGCSSVTTYVESAAGVSEGGRTGLTSVVAGILFLLAVFFTPLVAVVPAYATAPALILVGFLLISGVRSVRWDDVSTALPVFLIIVMIPFTFSISKGIGCGFIAYVLLKWLAGKKDEVHPLLALVALLFAVDFYLS
ncbi:MAG: NCS2 family permease [Acidobacteria bacterium]|nr:NCS2 family permease [Acidobacteriota bacterium]MBU4307940.1 NCS2 family permease [Acidobacteriota bacterium]MCG2811810.1 NCS2 family permease [Candidatus Aminicenantes bacterium]